MQKGRVKSEVISSSGNVFADLGVTNAEEKQTKVRLAVTINQIIQGRKLTQMAAARRLNVNQPKVSGYVQLPAGRFFCRTTNEFSHRPGS